VSAPAKVECACCKKQVDREHGAMGINGRWSCLKPKCIGEVMRLVPSVRDVARQLGLFGGKEKGSP